MLVVKKLAFSLLIPTLLAGSAFAQSRGPADDAHALAEKAIAHIQSVGPEKAFADFTARDGKWNDRAFYVSVIKFDGTMVANAANGAMVGRNLIDAKDINGKPFVREMGVLVKEWAEGGVEYSETNRLTKKVELKVSYGMRIPYFDGYVAVSTIENAGGLLAAN